MGYGIGIVMLAVGLILALAVQDTISGVDLTMVGWILAIVGAAALLLTAAMLGGGRGSHTRTTTRRADGTQTVRETRSDV
jgi:hypothetical protein